MNYTCICTSHLRALPRKDTSAWENEKEEKVALICSCTQTNSKYVYTSVGQEISAVVTYCNVFLFFKKWEKDQKERSECGDLLVSVCCHMCASRCCKKCTDEKSDKDIRLERKELCKRFTGFLEFIFD